MADRSQNRSQDFTKPRRKDDYLGWFEYGLEDLREAVRVVNTVKKTMGDALALSLDGGQLRAMMELG